MSDKTGIPWCDSTWNPIAGCSLVSPGCSSCYAMRDAHRLGTALGQEKYAGLTEKVNGHPVWNGTVRLWPPALDQPLRWKRGRRIFVNSMSDLFHEGLSDLEIAAVFGVMLLAKQHTFQVLTKRPERMRRWFEWIEGNPLFVGKDKSDAVRIESGPAHSCLTILGELTPAAMAKGPLFSAVLLGGMQAKPDAPIRSLWPLPNVWLGVSAENQATADERIPILLQTPAAVRFVSYEPALEAVDFEGGEAYPSTGWLRGWHAEEQHVCGGDFERCARRCPEAVQVEHEARIDWLIVGGESGPRARPFDIAWARSAVEQCRAAGVACFVKQLGSNPLVYRSEADRIIASGGRVEWDDSDEEISARLVLRHPAGADPSEWPEDLRIQQFPEANR